MSSSQAVQWAWFSNDSGNSMTFRHVQNPTALLSIQNNAPDVTFGVDDVESTLGLVTQYDTGDPHVYDLFNQYYTNEATEISRAQGVNMIAPPGVHRKYGIYRTETGLTNLTKMMEISGSSLTTQVATWYIPMELSSSLTITGSVTASSFTLGGSGQNLLLDNGTTVTTSSFAGGAGFTGLYDGDVEFTGSFINIFDSIGNEPNGYIINSSSGTYMGRLDDIGVILNQIHFTDTNRIQILGNMNASGDIQSSNAVTASSFTIGGQRGLISTRSGLPNRLTFYPDKNITSNFFELLNNTSDFVFELQAAGDAKFRAYRTPLVFDTEDNPFGTISSISFQPNYYEVLNLTSGSGINVHITGSVDVGGEVNADTFNLNGSDLRYTIPTASNTTNIDMGYSGGHYLYMSAPTNATTFTTTNPRLGGWAKVRISGSTEPPTVTGATFISGAIWNASPSGSEQYLGLEYNGNIVEYFFLDI